jgi:nucleotide-binding universal stress UspA family protein
MCKKILVTLDGSKASEAIIPVVVRAAAPGAEVTLFTVTAVPPAVIRGTGPLVAAGAAGGAAQLAVRKTVETRDQAMNHLRERNERYLDQAAKPLREAGITVRTHVAFGDAAEEIVAFARHENVEVIMMATHGRTALAEVLLGSVAGQVVREASIPVMSIRPNDLN